MLWIIFAMLFIMGLVAIFGSYTMAGGIIQILLGERAGGDRDQSYSAV